MSDKEPYAEGGVMVQEAKAVAMDPRPLEGRRCLSRMEMEQVLGALMNTPRRGVGPSPDTGIWARFTEEELEKLLGMELGRLFGERCRTGGRPISI